MKIAKIEQCAQGVAKVTRPGASPMGAARGSA
jgi:hypothetical protein